MMKLFRLFRILGVFLRFGLLHAAAAGLPGGFGPLRLALRLVPEGRRRQPRAARLRLALEALGPIFVKFGQVLSTRQDLLPPDIAVELALLQDRVRPFDGETARRIVERAQGAPLDAVFQAFDRTPAASASVAQVHFATLHDGREVAVKVLRPGIHAVIRDDLALMRVMAGLAARLLPDGRRLKPREVVDEFAKHLNDELDLTREAASASQLRRNFQGSALLVVPEIHWDYCHGDVMVMERMHGTPISQVDALAAAGVDIPKLARAGVEIFFTQVFRDGFFHADMHPGNILVNDRGQYVALDFGIMGTLTDVDRNYLAVNFLAFFKRDYRRVAVAHVEAGWAPAGTRVDEFEAAIRAVCEPIFDRPLKDISFGKVLLRLFQTSRRFGIEIQPQLVLLQKTMLNIEGLGRQLDPDLDLWDTAKPFLERWMSEQVGWRGLLRAVREEAPFWGRSLPYLPRLAHQALSRAETRPDHAPLLRELARQNRLLKLFILLLAALFLWAMLAPQPAAPDDGAAGPDGQADDAPAAVRI